MNRLLIMLTVLSLTLTAMATERIFTQQEVLGKDWGRDLLHYAVTFAPGETTTAGVVLLDANARGIPFQLSEVTPYPDGSVKAARVSFYGELKAYGTMRYTLSTGAPKPPAFNLGVKATQPEKGPLELRNKFTGVRLPASATFEVPKALADVPGPIQGYALGSGGWTGGSRFTVEGDGAPKVTGSETTLLTTGPLFTEARVRYTLTNGGYYTVRVRLEADAPMVFVAEEADTKLVDAPEIRADYFLSSPTPGGWIPDLMYRFAERNPAPTDPAVEKAMTDAGITPQQSQPRKGTLNRLPKPAQDHDLFGVAAWYVWSDSAWYTLLLREGELSSRYRGGVGLIPLHAGSWRNGQGSHVTCRVKQLAGGPVYFSVPLTAPKHPGTYLDTGEFDTRLPVSLVRRQWGMLLGPLPQSLQALWDARLAYGHVTLNDYKDWRLDWPENPAVTYPRLPFTSKELAGAKGVLDTHAFKDVLSQFSDVSGNTEGAWNLAQRMTTPAAGIWTGGSPVGHALYIMYGGGDSQIPWASHYRQEQAAGWSLAADEALAWKGMPAALRRRVRACLAACAYALTEPDANSRASGIHQGNPNMPANRFLALPHVAALIPDHPMAKQWLDVSAQYTTYKLTTGAAPKGAWGELITYYEAAVPGLLQSAVTLQNSGRAPDALINQVTAVPRWAVNLLTPKDPRFGARIIPGYGHGGVSTACYELPAGVLLRNLDPKAAGGLAWAWDQMGRPMSGGHGFELTPRLVLHADALAKNLKPGEVPADLLASRWYPGMGVIFRAHAGDPNETYFGYRQGYMVSHCDPNQGDFVLYSKGAPLSPEPLRGYVTHQDNDCDWGGPKGLSATKGDIYNRIRFGKASDHGGWPGGGLESNVNEVFTGASVDYLRGWGDYSRTDTWNLSSSADNLTTPGQDAIRWTRQVLFLKGKAAAGPNYFVIRDTFAGGKQPKWWHLRGSVLPEQIKFDGQTVEIQSPWGANLHATFLQPQGVKPELVSGKAGLYLYNHTKALWEKSQPGVPQVEQVTVAQVPAGENDEFLVVLYPRKPVEALPVTTQLAPGAVKSVTAEGTDYAFLSGGDANMTFNTGGIRFTGRAGTVRVYPDAVHLIVTAADGIGEVGYQGTVYRGAAPFEFILPTAKMKAGTVTLPAPKYAVNAADPKLLKTGEGIVFEGASGGVQPLPNGGVRLVLGPGKGKVGFGKCLVWGEGPFDLTYDNTGLHGITDGRERMIYATHPHFERGLTTLWIDGTGWAPGFSNDYLAIPVLAGKHDIAIKPAAQPDIFE
jgi:hypothetical protein